MPSDSRKLSTISAFHRPRTSVSLVYFNSLIFNRFTIDPNGLLHPEISVRLSWAQQIISLLQRDNQTTGRCANAIQVGIPGSRGLFPAHRSRRYTSQHLTPRLQAAYKLQPDPHRTSPGICLSG